MSGDHGFGSAKRCPFRRDDVTCGSDCALWVDAQKMCSIKALACVGIRREAREEDEATKRRMR